MNRFGVGGWRLAAGSWRLFVGGLLLALVLSSCAPDPRREAQAYQIREAADQDALNQAQDRAQDKEVHALEVERLQVEQGHREATAARWRAALNVGIDVVKWFAIAAVCYSLLSVAQAVSRGSRGLAEALVRAAEVRANLIALDPKTRQYPLLVQPLGRGKFAALNPNTNSVLMLDVRSEPDRRMIQAMGAVQYAGALASEARQANDPSGVAIIQTPLIDVRSSDE